MASQAATNTPKRTPSKVESLKTGAKCKAKAICVTNLKECSRRFGIFAKQMEVEGVVVLVKSTLNPTTNRRLNTVFARFDFGDGYTKEKTLHMKSIEIWSPLWTPPSPLETIPLVGTAIAANIPPISAQPPTDTLDSTLLGGATVAPALPPVVNSPDIPVVTKHGVDWYDDSEAILDPVASTPARKWSLTTPIGETLHPGSNEQKYMSISEGRLTGTSLLPSSRPL